MARGRLAQASRYSSAAIAKLEALFAMMQEEDFAIAASLYTIVLEMKIASGELYNALENGQSRDTVQRFYKPQLDHHYIRAAQDDLQRKS